MSLKQQNKTSSSKTRRKNTQVKCRANCAQHKFVFKPKLDKQYHQKATIQYCPVRCDQDKVENVIPQINPDGKKYYPLFWIDLDKDHYKQHEEKYKDEHEKKVVDYLQEKKELYEPKPGRKTKWCAVCKVQYNDYLDHVSKKEHGNHLMNNKFIEEINKIAELYPYKKRQEYAQLQVKTTSEEISNKENVSTTLENNDMESEVIIENATKQKVIINLEQYSYQNQNQNQINAQKKQNNLPIFNHFSNIQNQSAKFNSQQTQDIILKNSYHQQQQQQQQQQLQKTASYLNNSEIIFFDNKNQQNFQSNPQIQQTQQQQQQQQNFYPQNQGNFQKQQQYQQQQYLQIQNNCNPGVFQQSNNSLQNNQNQTGSIAKNNSNHGTLIISQHNQSENQSYNSQFKQQQNSKKRSLAQRNPLSLHESQNLEVIKKQQKNNNIIDLTQDDNNDFSGKALAQKQQNQNQNLIQQQQQTFSYTQEPFYQQQNQQCKVQQIQQINQDTQFQTNNQNNLMQQKQIFLNAQNMMPINQAFNQRWQIMQNPADAQNQFNKNIYNVFPQQQFQC